VLQNISPLRGNTYGPCENDLVGSSVVVEEPHKSEAGNEAEYSQVGAFVPKDLSENMVLPSSPLAREEEKDSRPFEHGLAGSSIEPETSKGFEAQMASKMDVSNANVIIPEIRPEHMVLPQSSLEAEENINGILENAVACCLVVPEGAKGSEVENDDQMGTQKVSDSVQEIVDPLPSSLVIEEDQVEGSSKKGALCFSVIVQNSGGSEAEAGEQLDASHAETLVRENVSENMVLPRSSLVSEAPVVEGSSEQDIFGFSVVLETSKGSATNNEVQVNPSQVDGVVPETNTGIWMQESEIARSSENHQDDSSVAKQSKPSAIEKGSQMIVSEVGGIVHETSLENSCVPSVSETKSENANCLYEKSSHCVLLALEEAKQSETESSNQLVVSDFPMTGPENSLENICQSSCSLTMEADKTEGSSRKSSCDISVAMEESKKFEKENDESHVGSMECEESQVVGTSSEHTQVGSIGPEDTSGNTNKSSYSSEMQEGKIEGSSQNIPEESNRPEAETDDQTQYGGMAVANMSENIEGFYSSGMQEDKIEGSSLNVPEESNRLEAETDDQTQFGGMALAKMSEKIEGSSLNVNRSEAEIDDQAQCGGMALANMPEKIEGISSSGMQEDKIEGSSLNVAESNRLEAETDDQTQFGWMALAKMSEKIEGSSLNVPEESNRSEAEIDDQAQCGGMALADMPEKIEGISSSGMQEDKIEGSSLNVAESNRLEAETDDQTQFGWMALAKMSEKIEGSSLNVPEESNRSEAEIDDQAQCGGMALADMPEKIEGISSSGMQEDKIEGSSLNVAESNRLEAETDDQTQFGWMALAKMSEKIEGSSLNVPEESNRSEAEIDDQTQFGGMALAKMSEKIEGTSQNVPEESNRSEAETNDQVQCGGMALANMLEKIEDVSFSGMQEDKIEGSSQNVPEESNRSEAETDDQTQFGGMALAKMSEKIEDSSLNVPEESNRWEAETDDQAQCGGMTLANMPEKIEDLCSSGMQEEKIEGSSLNVPEESKRQEAETVTDDETQCDGMAPANMLPSSSLLEEKTDVLSEKDPAE